MSRIRSLGVFVGWLGLAGPLCAPASATEGAPPATPNVLLIIADDLGVDRVGAYAAHPDPGHTPVIDQLAAQGMLFRSAYSDPLCSPTRATILTGRYGYRTGMSDALNWQLSKHELALAETTIPEALPATYRSAAIGKWHLTTTGLSGPLHPLLQGFEHHAGSMANFEPPEGYFAYMKSVDGVLTPSSTYATTDTVDDALAWIGGTSEPWFVWLAFNAPHAPWHKPPDELHTFDLPAEIEDDVSLHHKAAVEAMDTEIGRLLDGLGPELLAQTVVIFVGDNGTPGPATTAPYDPLHAKGQVYEGGCHVPLIVRGPGVAVGTECAALVNTTDLFATIVELCGADPVNGVDSLSLRPYFADPRLPSARKHVYSGLYLPVGYYPGYKHLRAVRDRRHKLLHVRHDTVGIDKVEMYDVLVDPFELNDLLLAPLSPAAQTAHDVLVPLLEQAYPPWQLMGGGIPGVSGPIELRGTGPLLPDEPFLISLRRAPPVTPAQLAFGLGLLQAPLLGGSLVPDVTGPASGIATLVTNASGQVDIPALWPPGVPSGLHLYMQFWLISAAGPQGWVASNGLAAVAP